jgi:hypothetical protein
MKRVGTQKDVYVPDFSNFEFGSNVSDVSHVHLEKQDSLMISILDLISTVVDLPK